MNMESEDLNYLFSFIMELDMEVEFYKEMLIMFGKKDFNPINDASALEINALSEFVFKNALDDDKKSSVDYLLAKNAIGKAMVFNNLSEKGELVQKVYDLRKKYLMMLTPLERLLLKRRTTA